MIYSLVGVFSLFAASSVDVTSAFNGFSLSGNGKMMQMRSSKSSALDATAAYSSSSANGVWNRESWRTFPPTQMPVYENQEELDATLTTLKKFSPLVFAGEIRDLSKQLADATQGNAFLLMGGDCAESFDEFTTDHVRDTFRVLLQMSLILTFGSAMPVIKVGRMAGQFAKPRSEATETKDGVTLPSYRGDIINSEAFTEEARKNRPENMIKAYQQSVQTLNILRAFASGGYADIARLHTWNLDFCDATPQAQEYKAMATEVDKSLRFMSAIGIDTDRPEFTGTKFFTAHECLLLPYEEALTREDSITGKQYALSAHMLWVGERTRQMDGAHLEFLRGVGNPVGVKISDKCTPEELIEICDKMNPMNIPGRLTVIVRMGAEKLTKNLPALIDAVQREKKSVLWISDPVHGNTYKTESGYKTRDFNAIRAELRAFFDVHNKMKTHPGGVHLEMTGEDVTECVGGSVSDVNEKDLNLRYHTQCDPRLNGQQALELAFLISKRMGANIDKI